MYFKMMVCQIFKTLVRIRLVTCRVNLCRLFSRPIYSHPEYTWYGYNKIPDYRKQLLNDESYFNDILISAIKS